MSQSLVSVAIVISALDWAPGYRSHLTTHIPSVYSQKESPTPTSFTFGLLPQPFLLLIGPSRNAT